MTVRTKINKFSMTKQQHWEQTETPANQESKHSEKENPSSSSSKTTRPAKRKKTQQQQIRLDNCIVPMQCTGCFPRGKRAAIVRRYPVVFLFFPCVQCVRVSVINRTLDMDYRIFSVRTLLCVRIHTRGWGTPTTSQHNIFDSEQNSHKLFVCSGRDSNLWSWNPLDLEGDAVPIEPPRPPNTC